MMRHGRGITHSAHIRFAVLAREHTQNAAVWMWMRRKTGKKKAIAAGASRTGRCELNMAGEAHAQWLCPHWVTA
jgi:hypothetical protein